MTKPEELYLDEDKDLLKELEEANPEVNNPGPVTQDYKLNSMQIKATLRHRKSMDKFDKSTTSFSLILMILAIIQIIVALMQFTFDLLGDNKSLSYIFGAIFFILMLSSIKLLYKIDKNKS